MDVTEAVADALHHPVGVRLLSRSASSTQHNSVCSVHSGHSRGLLGRLETSSQDSGPTSLRHSCPPLVKLVQTVPQTNDGVGLLVGESIGALIP